MANFFNFGQRMVERQTTNAAAKANPMMAKGLMQMRNTGAPVPSLAQMLGFGMGQGGQRKAGPDKTMMGMMGAAKNASMSPKAGMQMGKPFSIADFFGLRPGGRR